MKNLTRLFLCIPLFVFICQTNLYAHDVNSDGQIGLEEGADRPDIRPVALEWIRRDPVPGDGVGDDLSAEIGEI